MAIFSSTPRIIRDTALADATASALCDRLRDVRRQDFARALWIGGGDAGALASVKAIDTLEVRPFPVEGAIEHFPHDPASLDLIAVNGTLNIVNDLPGVLVQMRRTLKPDGLFICAMTGGETLFELRESITRAETALRGGAGTRIHPMVDLQTWAGLMQRAGFALPVADAEVRTIFYRDFKTLLRDIKRSGEGMALAEKPRRYVGRGFWDAVADAYRAAHATADGLLPASVEILYAIGWGPADSQPQPLKPGSAKNRLADALGSEETALPDSARPH